MRSGNTSRGLNMRPISKSRTPCRIKDGGERSGCTRNDMDTSSSTETSTDKDTRLARKQRGSFWVV
ncbi:hypothetical protein PM082_015729 [Marasmius tenuissimus]|nr:hypothetical protein PM082_015729 [Marasmius tenuissimus]